MSGNLDYDMNITDPTIIDNDTRCHQPSSAYVVREFVVLGIISGTLSLFGLFSNMISLWIYRTRRMARFPINWYFAVMSASDFTLCLCSFLLFSLPSISVFSNDPGAIGVAAHIVHRIYPLALIAQSCCVWITVSVAVYRYVGICFPLKSLHACTPKLVKQNIFCVILLCIFYNIPRCFEVGIMPCIYWEQSPSKIITFQLTEEPLRGNSYYKIVYVTICYILLLFLIPITTLFIVTLSIIYALRKSSKFQSISSKSIKRKKSCRTAEIEATATNERSTSIMLVVLVVFFIFCNILPLVCNVLEVLFTYVTDGNNELIKIYHVLVDVGNLMTTVNSSMNIFIYYFCGRQYRHILRRAFSRPTRPVRKNAVLDNDYSLDSRYSTRRERLISQNSIRVSSYLPTTKMRETIVTQDYRSLC